MHPRRVRRIAASVVRWSIGLTLASFAVSAIVIGLTIWHYESGLPSIAQLRKGYRPPEVTRVLARDHTLLAQIFRERRTVVAFKSVPPQTKLAFLAAEDASFYEHEGLNYLGMLRALVVNLRAGRTVQGGSTITQQVVKNLLLSPERTLARKVQETILARRLEQTLGKDEILGLYLNTIYLGHGRYGVEEAARFYFGKHTSELDLPESALLAGLVASPERYSPRHDPKRALERRRFVIQQMRAKGFITAQLAQQALATPLKLAPAAEEESDLAPEMVAWAERYLTRIVGPDARRGGYTIETTIDPSLQALARKAVRNGLSKYQERHEITPPYAARSRSLWGSAFGGTPRRNHIYVGTVVSTDDAEGTIDVRVGDRVGRVHLVDETFFNDRHLAPSRFAETGAALRVVMEGDPDTPMPELRLDLAPQAALVAIDPRTRQVLALVGSRDALAGGLDRATQAVRQPGSAFKPVLYSYALHARQFTVASVLELPPRSPGDEPRHLSVREAIAHSDNAAAEFLLQQVGASNVVSWAHALGIHSSLAPTPSLALGAYEVSPLEMTNVYASFASGGFAAPTVFVTRIAGHGGQLVTLPPDAPRHAVLSAEEAYLTTSLLRSVVEVGTGQRAKRVGRPVAGKTGTTNDAKDAWFVGYSPDLVCGVWVGYDDALPLGRRESGAVAALPIWVEFVKGAESSRPVIDFARPPGIQLERIDPNSGLLASFDQPDAIEEVFLPGTAPTEAAPNYDSADAGVGSNPGPLAPPTDALPSVGGDKPSEGSETPPAEPAAAGSPPDDSTQAPMAP